MSFAELKKASKSGSYFESLNQKINALMNPSRQNDEREWQPTADKAGNGYAVIRFLPTPEKDEIPFVRVWDHGFKGPGGWYIEKSRTSLGPDEADPVTEYNAMLWNTGNKEDREFVQGIPGNKERPGSKRRLHFYSNILVINDPAVPANNGKVFIYRYGKKIWNKLNNMMNPKVPGLDKVNPFNLWTGANFNLVIERVEGQRSYDQSNFDKPSPVADTDAKIEAIWKQTYSLKEFVDPASFKSYDELKRKLDRVLRLGTRTTTTVEADSIAPQSFPKEDAPTQKETTPPWDTSDDDDDESELAKFRQLVNK